MDHRSDIDGLRGVAVGAVIVSHAELGGLPGGNLGVDVFFALSGYLIAAILLAELAQGPVRWGHFYERRARRILPALVPVIAACFPFAIWLMLPGYLENFGQSVVATILFGNNLLLALTSGYWELESSFKPLLHTWSLGVEEQFYLLFPAALALAHRFGRRGAGIAVAGLGLCSLATAEWGWRSDPAASFYLPHTCAWELMAGALAAFVSRRPVRGDALLSGAALLAVILPLALFDGATPGPSLFSAIPVAGTVGLLVFNRPGHLAWRLLSLRWLVGAGLVSYSAYLWHQPLFAFARVASFAPSGWIVMAALAVATFVLAWASWRFVEQPCRDASRVPMRVFVPVIGGALAGLLALGLMLHFTGGLAGADRDADIAYNQRIANFDAAAFPANGRPNLLILGDSMARDAGNVLQEAGALKGRNVIYRDALPACGPADEAAAAWLGPMLRDADAIVLSFNGSKARDADCHAPMLASVAARTRAPVIVFGGKSFGWNVNPFARVAPAERPRAMARVPAGTLAFDSAAAGVVPQGHYVSMLALLGPDRGRVRFFDDAGRALSPDRVHLTRAGARFVARRLIATRHPALDVIARSGASPTDRR